MHLSSASPSSLSPMQRRLHQQQHQPEQQLQPSTPATPPQLHTTISSMPIQLIPPQQSDSHQQAEVAPLLPLEKVWSPPHRKVKAQDAALQPLIMLPHPAYTLQKFLIIYDGQPAFHHPSLLQYPHDRIQCANDLLGDIFTVMTAKRLTQKSFDKYINTYTNMWYILTHILSVREDEGFKPADCINWAIRWTFQSKQPDQCTSVYSHLIHFIEAGIIPKSLVQMSHMKLLSHSIKSETHGTPSIAYRLLMPPQALLQIYHHIQDDTTLPLLPIEIYILLGIFTGQHLAESYNFCWKLHFDEHKSVMTWPAFKHRTEEAHLPVSIAFTKLHDYVKRHFPSWMTDTPIAHALWPARSDLSKQTTDRLADCKQNDDIFRGYSETLSHRVLRRTFASILHHFQCSHKTISHLLNHNSKKAVASYVSLFHVNHMEFIKTHADQFKEMLPPAEYTNTLNKPALFQPALPSGYKKNIVPADQPRITSFWAASTSRHHL